MYISNDPVFKDLEGKTFKIMLKKAENAGKNVEGTGEKV